MTATFIQVRVRNVNKVEAAMAGLDKKLRGKVLRAAVAKGRKVYIAALRQAAPVETKLLKKSIGARGKTYRGGAIALQTIGPRSGFRREVVVKRRDKHGRIVGRSKQLRDPRRYAHITEKRRPWIRPTFAAVTPTAISQTTDALEAELKTAMQQVAKV